MSPEVAKRIAHIPPSGIRRFFDIAATMKVVISRGIGEPDFVPPEPVLEAGIASLRRGETHYTSNSGILELRQALCDHLLRRYALRYNPADEIIITVGVSEALYLALVAVLDAGDEVIVPQPCFVAYGPEGTLAGGAGGGAGLPGHARRGFLPGDGGGYRARDHAPHKGRSDRLPQQSHRRGDERCAAGEGGRAGGAGKSFCHF